MSLSRALWLCFLIAPICASAQGQPVQQRALRLDDLAAEERLGAPKDWSIARDGALALTVERAPNTRRSWRVQGADVWVQLEAGQPLKRITDGHEDQSDWRDPLWSPNGSRLLLVSTRGGTRSLWIWERATSTLRALTKRSLGNGGASGDGKAFYEWLTDRVIVAAIVPAGERPPVPGLGDLKPMAQAKAGWNHFLSGELSASVLQAGRKDAPLQDGQQANEVVAATDLRQIVRIDVVNGQSFNVTGVYRPALANVFPPRLSSDGRFIAVWIHAAPVSTALNDVLGTVEVLIRRLDGASVLLKHPLPSDILWGSPVWSPRGAELAYFAFGSSRERAPKLVRVDAAAGQVTERDLGAVIPAHIRDDNWDFARLEWTETGEMVCLAGRGETALKKYARRDWWSIPKVGAMRNLSASLQTVPNLQRLSDTGQLVGLANDVLWKLDAARKTIRPITTPGALPSHARIVWPRSHSAAFTWAIGRNYLIHREERPANAVVVMSVDEQAGEHFTRVEVQTGLVTVLEAPGPLLSLARLSPQGEHAYWILGQPSSGSVWRTWIDARNTSPEKVLTLNDWQSLIAQPPEMVVNYPSRNGDAYSAWIQLPVGYRSDRRYPLIAEIYPGQDIKSAAGKPFSRIAAAAGFAVLRPQMGPRDSARRYGMSTLDPYFEVVNGVLPAIDKAIKLGIADGDRLFVEGWSMGGFTAFALVEQSTRFKAALVGAGTSDWTNGTFSARGRYGEDLAQLNIGWEAENLQQRPATETPWSDPELFRRNSPIVYADQIQTPLLMIHNDLDENVPMSHSEEMFSAMVQLNKRADFVRYWGEGHGVYNPTNIRDLWQRRLAWFDEFGDIQRDAHGELVFDGSRVQSRHGTPAFTPADYANFDLFQPGGPD